MEGEDTRYDGKEGVIEHIDGIGQLHGTWGSLAVIPEADDFDDDFWRAYYVSFLIFIPVFSKATAKNVV